LIPIVVYSAIGILLLMLAISPTRLIEWRRAIATGRARVSERGNTREPDESWERVDYRSVTSHGQTGGQTAWSITNEGPQPRRISKASGARLVKELEKRPSERFGVTPVTDPEATELAAILQQLLEQAGWDKDANEYSIGMSNVMPSGVIVETAVDSEAVTTLIEWMNRAGLNPRVNRGPREYETLRMSPSAPVHIVVGALPT
jgi:hypothetical protein